MLEATSRRWPAIAVAIACAAAFAATAVALPSSAKLTTAGLGPIKIGMTVAQVEAAGKRELAFEGGDANAACATAALGSKLFGLFSKGRLARIYVAAASTPRARTSASATRSARSSRATAARHPLAAQVHPRRLLPQAHASATGGSCSTPTASASRRCPAAASPRSTTSKAAPDRRARPRRGDRASAGAALARLWWQGRTATGEPATPATGTATGPAAAIAQAAWRLRAQGCLACHQIGSEGNSGPGNNLTGIGARRSSFADARGRRERRGADAVLPRPAPRARSTSLVAYLSALRDSAPARRAPTAATAADRPLRGSTRATMQPAGRSARIARRGGCGRASTDRPPRAAAAR